jgi:hypothetical protein
MIEAFFPELFAFIVGNALAVGFVYVIILGIRNLFRRQWSKPRMVEVATAIWWMSFVTRAAKDNPPAWMIGIVGGIGLYIIAKAAYRYVLENRVPAERVVPPQPAPAPIPPPTVLAERVVTPQPAPVMDTPPQPAPVARVPVMTIHGIQIAKEVVPATPAKDEISTTTLAVIAAVIYLPIILGGLVLLSGKH